MDQEEARQPLTGEARLAAYLDAIAGVLGHAGRVAAAQAYCTGLLLPGERKSIEPMAARLDPTHVQAKHQSLHHVVAQAAWDDAAVLAAVRAPVLPAIARHGPVLYWIVDDTSFPGRALTRWGWRGSIAVSWASRTTARACPGAGPRGCTHLGVPDWLLLTAEASRRAQGYAAVHGI